MEIVNRGQEIAITFNKYNEYIIKRGTTNVTNDTFFKTTIWPYLCLYHGEKPGELVTLTVQMNEQEASNFRCFRGAELESCFCLRTGLFRGPGLPTCNPGGQTSTGGNTNNTPNPCEQEISTPVLNIIEKTKKGILISVQVNTSNIRLVNIYFSLCQNDTCRIAKHENKEDNVFYIDADGFNLNSITTIKLTVVYKKDNTICVKGFDYAAQALLSQASNPFQNLEASQHINLIYRQQNYLFLGYNFPEEINTQWSHYSLGDIETYLIIKETSTNDTVAIYEEMIKNRGRQTTLLKIPNSFFSSNQYQYKIKTKAIYHSLDNIQADFEVEKETDIELASLYSLINIEAANFTQKCNINGNINITIGNEKFREFFEKIEIIILDQQDVLYNSQLSFGNNNVDIELPQNKARRYNNLQALLHFYISNTEKVVDQLNITVTQVIGLLYSETVAGENGGGAGGNIPNDLYKGPFRTRLRLFDIQNTSINNMRVFFMKKDKTDNSTYIENVFSTSIPPASSFFDTGFVTLNKESFHGHYAPRRNHTAFYTELSCGNKTMSYEIHNMDMPILLFSFAEFFNANGVLVSTGNRQPFTDTIPLAVRLYSDVPITKNESYDVYIGIGYKAYNNNALANTDFTGIRIEIEENGIQRYNINNVFTSQLYIAYHNDAANDAFYQQYDVKIFWHKESFVLVFWDSVNSYWYLFRKTKNIDETRNNAFLSNTLAFYSDKIKKILLSKPISGNTLGNTENEVTFDPISLTVPANTNVYGLALFYPPFGAFSGSNPFSRCLYNPYAFSPREIYTVSSVNNLAYFDHCIFHYLARDASSSNTRHIVLVSNIVSNTSSGFTRQRMRNYYSVMTATDTNPVTYLLNVSVTNITFQALNNSQIGPISSFNIFTRTIATTNIQSIDIYRRPLILLYGGGQILPNQTNRPGEAIMPESVVGRILSQQIRTDRNRRNNSPFTNENGFNMRSISFNIHIKRHIRFMQIMYN